MQAFDSSDATAILADLCAGDGAAADKLLPLVYDELRALAGHLFKQEQAAHTLQPTALVHEAYLKLIRADHLKLNDRAHFIAVAAKAMRQILTDYARLRRTDKRGGAKWQRVTLDDALAEWQSQNVDVLHLSEVIDQLAELSPRQGQIVDLRVFGGLTIEETAQVLQVGPTTVKSDWLIAKAWLKRALADPCAS
ncbi:MAG: sigma-70 family RNA polymerase sigma factor [Planctomycetes bacterium]|nr:sigma-70 family RNA polymerase sigma factor [Planctomycetota bacterium]